MREVTGSSPVRSIMKAKKITAEDRKRMLAVVEKLQQKDKDQLLAELALFAQRAIIVLDELTKQSSLSPKEKKEIEDSISVGPQWLNYRRRVRREK